MLLDVCCVLPAKLGEMLVLKIFWDHFFVYHWQIAWKVNKDTKIHRNTQTHLVVTRFDSCKQFSIDLPTLCNGRFSKYHPNWCFPNFGGSIQQMSSSIESPKSENKKLIYQNFPGKKTASKKIKNSWRTKALKLYHRIGQLCTIKKNNCYMQI